MSALFSADSSLEVLKTRRSRVTDRQEVLGARSVPQVRNRIRVSGRAERESLGFPTSIGTQGFPLFNDENARRARGVTSEHKYSDLFASPFSMKPTRDSVSESNCAGGVVVLRQQRSARGVCAVVALALCVALLVASMASAGAVTVNDEATFRAAWSNPAETQIDLTADITLTCNTGAAQRNSATPLTLDGHGHTITPACMDHPSLVVLNAASDSGSSPVTFRNVTINRGHVSNSVVAGANMPNAAPSGVSQVITVDVRRRHHHQPRNHEPRHHQPVETPVSPLPASPVTAVVTFTG